jgi:Protein of unknown function (DUF1573).
MKQKFDRSMRGVMLVTLVLSVGLLSCKQDKKRSEVEKIVQKWMGKEVQFPKEYLCSTLGKDTITALCADLLDKEYKVLLYVDSTGCTSCKLNLFQWSQLIEESDSLFEDKLSFLFFFNPKDKRDLQILLRGDRMDYPVFMDFEDKINKLNRFPEQQSYQCFLLDKDNKVVMIGNPTLNPRVWELYKERISGEGTIKQNTTSIELDQTSYDFGNIPFGESRYATFQLKNTGDTPLIINHIAASCGCTSVEWDKKPIEPGKTTEIKVEMKPDEVGFFNKAITVHCNIKESAVKLTISGTAQ